MVRAPHTELPIQPPWVAVMNRRTEIARKFVAELTLQASKADPRPDISAFFADPPFT